MNILNKILYPLLQPTVVLLVGVLTIFFNSKFNKNNISSIRLEKVYHPLFIEIQPILYKEIMPEVAQGFIDKYYEIYEENSLYVDHNLHDYITHFVFCVKTNDKEWKIFWNNICSHIDKTYDKLSKLSHIPIRGKSYRIRHRQYETKSKLNFDLFILMFPQTLFFVIMLYFFYQFITSM